MKKFLGGLFSVIFAFGMIYTKWITSHQKQNDIPWWSSAKAVFVESVFWTFIVCGVTYVLVKFGDDDGPKAK